MEVLHGLTRSSIECQGVAWIGRAVPTLMAGTPGRETHETHRRLVCISGALLATIGVSEASDALSVSVEGLKPERTAIGKLALTAGTSVNTFTPHKLTTTPATA